MKKSILTLLMILVSLAMGAQSAHHKSKSTKNIYYVVVGSFENYKEAQWLCNNGPYDATWGNVFKAKSKGKTIYRVCDSCYYNKAKAEKRAKEIQREFNINAWVWTNKGQAKCTEPTLGNDGEYYVISPE